MPLGFVDKGQSTKSSEAVKKEIKLYWEREDDVKEAAAKPQSNLSGKTRIQLVYLLEKVSRVMKNILCFPRIPGRQRSHNFVSMEGTLLNKKIKMLEDSFA